jgi:serine/threonine-protein kinase
MALFDKLKAGGKGRLDLRQRFEITREPYQGRRSKVYIGKDRKSGETFAIKILDPKKIAEYESRFKGLNKPTEGEISVQFNHPYIVKTHESGLTSDGCPYLVMEPLGTGLNNILPVGEQALPGRRLQYLRQVAAALDVVHKAGFVHRDLCPRNLLFTEDGDTLKLTDFGHALPATGRFLEPGNRTGIPQYMAPELIRLQKTDQRLDIFAFGVIAYEMFTFKLPWESEMGQTAAVWHSSPPIDIRSQMPEICPALADAIMECIQPDVTKRCRSMTDFINKLRRIEQETAE